MTNYTKAMDTYTVTFDPNLVPGAHHELTSDYVETFYMPLLGPLAIATLRALGRIYDQISYSNITPTTYLPLGPFSQALGQRRRTGEPTTRVLHSFNRLERPYEFIERTGETSLTIAALLPTLHAGRFSRLPAHLQTLHAAELATI